MSEKRYKRFYVSESENQLTIYDNEGLDDYYHLGNDERDVKGICDLLNYQDRLIEEQHDEIINWTKKYVGIKKENEQLKKARDESDKFIVKKGLEIEFLNWCVENE